jgi:predicted secreted Zn-dependent protease
MSAQKLMIDLMAEIIADDDAFKEDRLNDEQIWDQFMDHVLNHIQMHPDDTIRQMLQSIDVADFQTWIDDPAFWDEINREVERKIMICKKMFSTDQNVGHC